MPMPIEQLNEDLGIKDAAIFEYGLGGLPRLQLQTEIAQAHVYLHGAHVTHFQAVGDAPVLWVSPDSRFEDGMPIRGGVPICFPWFAHKKDDESAPLHGLVRIQSWDIKSVERLKDGSLCAVLEINLPVSDVPDSQQFQLEYRIEVFSSGNPGLGLTLDVHNDGPATSFEQALHTYLHVGDVRRVQLMGLEGATYIDKTDGMTRKFAESGPMNFESETDRVFVDTTTPCQMIDPVLGRTVQIEKTGSNSTVVWNPWSQKARRMEDFTDDLWPDMLCIESGNVSENRVALETGAVHRMGVKITSGPCPPS